MDHDHCYRCGTRTSEGLCLACQRHVSDVYACGLSWQEAWMREQNQLPAMAMEERTQELMRYYILDGHTPVAVGLITWMQWMEQSDAANGRRVALTEIGEVTISTVFLGLDHGFGGRPLLFETLVFGGPLPERWMDRYETWNEAEQGHQAMVARVHAMLAATLTEN